MASRQTVRGVQLGTSPLAADMEDRASFELTEEDVEAIRLRFQSGAGGGLGQFLPPRPAPAGGALEDPDFVRWKVRRADVCVEKVAPSLTTVCGVTPLERHFELVRLHLLGRLEAKLRGPEISLSNISIIPRVQRVAMRIALCDVVGSLVCRPPMKGGLQTTCRYEVPQWQVGIYVACRPG